MEQRSVASGGINLITVYQKGLFYPVNLQCETVQTVPMDDVSAGELFRQDTLFQLPISSLPSLFFPSRLKA